MPFDSTVVRSETQEAQEQPNHQLLLLDLHQHDLALVTLAVEVDFPLGVVASLSAVEGLCLQLVDQL